MPVTSLPPVISTEGGNLIQVGMTSKPGASLLASHIGHPRHFGPARQKAPCTVLINGLYGTGPHFRPPGVFSASSQSRGRTRISPPWLSIHRNPNGRPPNNEPHSWARCFGPNIRFHFNDLAFSLRRHAQDPCGES